MRRSSSWIASASSRRRAAGAFVLASFFMRSRAQKRFFAVGRERASSSAAASAAATGSLLRARQGDGAAEVFLLRRHRGASFMAQAFVFPGGARDGTEDLRATAARELLEEANVRLDSSALVPFSHWITPSAEKK